MEENVQQELDTLKRMLLNWRRSYLGMASGDGGDDYLAEELADEISLHISPYVEKLHRFGHLTQSEASEFLDYCHGQVEELRDTIRKMTNKDPKGDSGVSLLSP